MRPFILDLAGPLNSQNKTREHDRRGQHHGEGQHAGLLLQRAYLCENATGDNGNPNEKRAIFQAAISAAGMPGSVECMRSRTSDGSLRSLMKSRRRSICKQPGD